MYHKLYCSGTVHMLLVTYLRLSQKVRIYRNINILERLLPRAKLSDYLFGHDKINVKINKSKYRASTKYVL